MLIGVIIVLAVVVLGVTTGISAHPAPAGLPNVTSQFKPVTSTNAPQTGGTTTSATIATTTAESASVASS